MIINNIDCLIRFASHVNIPENPNDCWEWIGSKNSKGYGRVRINNKIYLAHRIFFESFIGEIPEGMCVCHSCDNPCCINPSHLFLGTQLENIIDRDNKNHQARGKNNGKHKLIETDVYLIREFLDKGYTNKQIAKMFKVDPSVISNIKLGKRWSWLR